MPISKKIELSDIVLSNDKTEKELIKQLQDKVFEYLL
jgi:dephospho-CoA kinase